jgi:hypothetical protein
MKLLLFLGAMSGTSVAPPADTTDTFTIVLSIPADAFEHGPVANASLIFDRNKQ